MMILTGVGLTIFVIVVLIVIAIVVWVVSPLTTEMRYVSNELHSHSETSTVLFNFEHNGRPFSLKNEAGPQTDEWRNSTLTHDKLYKIRMSLRLRKDKKGHMYRTLISVREIKE